MRLCLFLCALVATAALTTAAPAGAADCAHATTQLQMDQCAAHALHADQTQLATAYDQIAKRLKSDPQ